MILALNQIKIHKKYNLHQKNYKLLKITHHKQISILHHKKINNLKLLILILLFKLKIQLIKIN
jgi:hypothetical protein